MVKIILLVIVGLVAVVLIYAASRPDTCRVERSLAINAVPEKIFPLINDFYAWDAWTPYNKDPAMKKTYGAVTVGKGATYAWEGNKEVGKGEISITDAIPPGRVEFELHMISPFEGRNRVLFTLTPQGDTTRVVWALEGQNSFLGKLIGLFVDVEKMTSDDFEKGLNNLKALAER